MYRFIAQPAWTLLPPKPGDPPPEAYTALESPVPTGAAIVPRALARVEFRTLTLLARAEAAASATPAVLARPPNDLPALLRTADQLLTFARQEAGERASVWRCKCGSRYAVPVSLVRPVSIRCQRCGETLDLDPTRTVGESNVADPVTTEVNDYRHAVAELFREAMARGWLVLVSRAEASGPS